MVNGLRAGLTWEAFLEANYWLTALHVEAYRRQYESMQELVAWNACHLYRAMCGSEFTVDDLMGRRSEKIDLINDPFALDKLADAEG